MASKNAASFKPAAVGKMTQMRMARAIKIKDTRTLTRRAPSGNDSLQRKKGSDLVKLRMGKGGY